MTLFKNKYRVETTRLKHWDYASAGYYFVTVCTWNREHFFGEVVGGTMRLSAVGEIARQCWVGIPAHFDQARLDEYIVMPNHLHGIVVIVETRHGASLQTPTANQFGPLKRGSLQSILNAYKGGVTRICREVPFAWQPRFYDHIVRNEEDLQHIRQYILNNPGQWEIDQDNEVGLWM